MECRAFCFQIVVIVMVTAPVTMGSYASLFNTSKDTSADIKGQGLREASANVKWDGFKVRFGIPFSRNFLPQPRTVADALTQGYRKISDCDSSRSALWRGNRYIKDKDFGLILLFDVNGYIAGIQTSVPENKRNGYPGPEIRPPFVFDTENRIWVVTAYFLPPALICTIGRSAFDLANEGTARDLYIQAGTDPDTQSYISPRQESDIKGTRWGNGRCFYAMGVHYWYNTSRNMSCDEVFPFFLMYDQGQLKAFGWALVTFMRKPSLENVGPPLLGFFLNPVPTCLPFQGVITSQHVYLVDDPLDIKCARRPGIRRRIG